MRTPTLAEEVSHILIGSWNPAGALSFSEDGTYTSKDGIIRVTFEICLIRLIPTFIIALN